MNTEVKSPVTGATPTKIFDKIKADDIIQAYKRQVGKRDISYFLKDVEEMEVRECVKTGYRFYYPYHVAGDADFYNAIQSSEGNSEDFYRKWGYDYEFAYNHINENESILDVGCGNGNFLKRVKEKTPHSVGLELNAEAVKNCQAAGLNVYNESIQHHAESKNSFYDVVCLFQVLEHVSDIREFLEASLKVLKKGGRLIIGVPNNEPYFQRFDKYSAYNMPPHHMGLWNLTAFDKLQSVFNIRLLKHQYESKGRWTVDAYLRAKYWLNIKTHIHHHTFLEKLKMLLLAPVVIPMSLWKHFFSGINGAFIVVIYEKL